MKELLLGNQAVARGAWQAGVSVVASYPGTPSTEITEAIALFPEVRAQWATNEKVSLEVAFGASLAGARSMVCMKHVGLNVAADPLFTASYTGVNGGLVVVVADDPGMHSSQNEQDSRDYARAAHLPMLEPSDSQECLDFTRYAFALSEAYDTPVLLRLTTRVAHSQSLAEVGEREMPPLKEYKKDVAKNVMMPAMAKGRHVALEARMERLSRDVNEGGCFTIQDGSEELGIVTSGIAYQYVMEAVPDAKVMKLGMVYPLPLEAIRNFAAQVKRLVVVEELEPFIQNQLLAAGIPCEGKELWSIQGEYTARGIAKALGREVAEGMAPQEGLPGRPPVMCPGCPHRGTFYVLHKMGLTVLGDIGCYTLGAAAPLSSIDACLCMGASIGMAMGMEKARGRDYSRKTISVIGDSTFLHSGMTGLVDAVYNGGHITVGILDNSITGMTGHQENPASGKDIYGNPAPAVSLEEVCASLGVQDIHVVDPFDLKAAEKEVRAALDYDGVSVVIFRRPCALLKEVLRNPKPPVVITDACVKCGMCMRIGCPAITRDADGMHIDATLCTGCGLCVGLCPSKAIAEGGKA